ncbi:MULTISPECIES: hypothetical protein [Hyphomicrobiales]|jgi:hypothetical protein|uniref:hypothetical protein n=1 Tax=Hyphomicrobiales TaxID=356 RepID=UPI00036291A4|nr:MULTISPECIES: hypothetical protein [Phyllobacteriaceae]MCX8570590.1 hypothetical protein [Aminobacter sp. MET-1]
MNVFVLCTGRCGSTTFAKACGHIDNFTSGHETRSRLVGADRLAYPVRHIEADNRLSWLLGRLEKKYGDNAHYVHLTRDPDAVAESFALRSAHGIMKGYRDAILMEAGNAAPISIARDMIDTVTCNIEAFLRNKTSSMQVRLETSGEDFARFWDWIGATGNWEGAAAEWSVRHNATAR